MDYKKLVESLEKMLPPKIPYGELVGAPWPYTGQGKMVYEEPESYFIEQAITAITDLLARVEAAESRAEKAEKELVQEKDAKESVLGAYMDNAKAMQRISIENTNLKEQLNSMKLKAEKAERERDIAVEQLHHCENNCDYCRNRYECDKETCFSPSPITGEPTDYWKWCGLEE